MHLWQDKHSTSLLHALISINSFSTSGLGFAVTYLEGELCSVVERAHAPDLDSKPAFTLTCKSVLLEANHSFFLICTNDSVGKITSRISFKILLWKMKIELL